MKPIVLATDGSPSAAEATLQAVELAHALDAPLVVVAVEHVTVPSYGYYGYAEVVSELRKIELEHVTHTLEQAAAVAAEHGVECDVVHAVGPVASEICQTAKQRGAQMIVIGAHGWSTIRRAWHGSVSTAVVHESHIPVLVVPSAAAPAAESRETREKVASQ